MVPPLAEPLLGPPTPHLHHPGVQIPDVPHVCFNDRHLLGGAENGLQLLNANSRSELCGLAITKAWNGPQMRACARSTTLCRSGLRAGSGSLESQSTMPSNMTGRWASLLQWAIHKVQPNLAQQAQQPPHLVSFAAQLQKLSDASHGEEQDRPQNGAHRNVVVDANGLPSAAAGEGMFDVQVGMARGIHKLILGSHPHLLGINSNRLAE
jgi:hypothetical protein